MVCSLTITLFRKQFLEYYYCANKVYYLIVIHEELKYYCHDLIELNCPIYIILFYTQLMNNRTLLLVSNLVSFTSKEEYIINFRIYCCVEFLMLSDVTIIWAKLRFLLNFSEGSKNTF